jgi:hypothetical protein
LTTVDDDDVDDDDDSDNNNKIIISCSRLDVESKIYVFSRIQYIVTCGV